MMSQILASDNMWRAWEHVRSKHGGPGLDHERVEDIEPCAERVLAEIGDRTARGAYRPGSLLSFEKQKSSGGTRELTIASMRDRILSRAISQILIARYNGVLLPQCYAYRPHRGALKAVSAIQKACREATFAVRADIESFFDTIDHDRLQEHLVDTGVPDDVMDLILRFVKATHFDGSASLRPTAGVPQGSPLSPMLANLYLNRFDHALEETHPRFVRYADDLVLLTDDIEDAHRGLNRIEELIREDGLKLSLAKTRVMRIDKGFLFLGFVFNRQGHSASKEARERLKLKLDEGAKADEFPEETQKRRQSISQGWKNYYGNSPEPETPKISLPSPEPISPAAKSLPRSSSPADASGIMAELRRKLAAGEVDPDDPEYAKTLLQLATHYHKAGLLAAASACRVEAGEPPDEPAPDPSKISEVPHPEVEAWHEILAAMQTPCKVGRADRLGRISYRAQTGGPALEDLIKHRRGDVTLAVPVHHSKDLVRFGVIDLDISRKTVEELGIQARKSLVERLRMDAMGLAQRAEEMGIPCVVELSGYKGVHVWFFSEKPLPLADMYHFLQTVVRISGDAPAGCHRELFPASAQPLPDGMQTHVKWLGGRHPLTSEMARILDQNGNCEPVGFLPEPSSCSVSRERLRQAVSCWNRYHQQTIPQGPGQKPKPIRDVSTADQLKQKCPVLNALCRKAEEEKDLSHPERMVVRGILGHLPGGEGREAVHHVIRNCANYDRVKTDSFLNSIPEKPMACGSIREILGDFCDHEGCNCTFRKLKNDYNHPLRHLRQQKPSSTKASPTPKKGVSPMVSPIRSKPASTSVDRDLSEVLLDLHDIRQKHHSLCRELQALVEINGNECQLGRLIQGDPDPDLPVWRIEV